MSKYLELCDLAESLPPRAQEALVIRCCYRLSPHAAGITTPRDIADALINVNDIIDVCRQHCLNLDHIDCDELLQRVNLIHAQLSERTEAYGHSGYSPNGGPYNWSLLLLALTQLLVSLQQDDGLGDNIAIGASPEHDLPRSIEASIADCQYLAKNWTSGDRDQAEVIKAFFNRSLWEGTTGTTVEGLK